MNYGWDKPIMTIMLHPERGRLKTEMPAIEILREPNRHQYESVTKAMTVCIFELCQLEIQRTERMMDIHRRIGKDGGVKNEPVQDQVRDGKNPERRSDNPGDERVGSPQEV